MQYAGESTDYLIPLWLGRDKRPRDEYRENFEIGDESVLEFTIKFKAASEITILNGGTNYPSFTSVGINYSEYLFTESTNRMNRIKLANGFESVVIALKHKRFDLYSGAVSASLDISDFKIHCPAIVLNFRTKTTVDNGSDLLTQTLGSTLSKLEYNDGSEITKIEGNVSLKNIHMKKNILGYQTYSPNMIILFFTPFFFESMNGLVSGDLNTKRTSLNLILTFDTALTVNTYCDVVGLGYEHLHYMGNDIKIEH